MSNRLRYPVISDSSIVMGFLALPVIAGRVRSQVGLDIGIFVAKAICSLGDISKARCFG